MGWKSDWLYRRVFEQFEKVWSDTHKSDRPFGPPPVEIFVTEYDQAVADNTSCHCKGNQIRMWRYTGGTWDLLKEPGGASRDNPIQGMYFQTARGCFHISKNRKTIVIQYTFGPRFGQSFAWAVQGQGRSTRLIRKPDTIGWIS